MSKEYPGVIRTPVVAECNIEGHSNVSSNVSTVEARCRTSGFRLVSAYRAEKGKPVRVEFDRSHMHHLEGDTWYICAPSINSYSDRFFGKETSVEAIITDTLKFVFPSENHKKVPVNLVHTVSYSPQYMAVSPIQVKPDSLIIYGETSRLEDVTEIRTQPLTLDQVDKDRRGVLKLNAPRGVRLSVPEIEYSLKVSRFVEISTTVNMQMKGAPAGETFTIYPSVAKVFLRCEFPLSGKNQVDDFSLYIDYNDFKSSINGRCVPRSGRLPSGVLGYKVDPEVFECLQLESN